MRARGGRFGCGRSGLNAATATVIAHSIDGDVVDDRLAVDISDIPDADIDHGPVIEHMAVPPITTLKAAATVPEAVIHATIEADMRTPIALVPGKGAAIAAPIPRSPKISGLRSGHPSARHPVITLVAGHPGPIARSKYIAVSRNRRLLI